MSKNIKYDIQIPSAGLISLASFLPAKMLSRNNADAIVAFLTKQTLLSPEYIQSISDSGKLPGWIESNEMGWSSQPWFDQWLLQLSDKHQQDPFRGAKERRRLPIDPATERNSLKPRPMLASDAETLAGALALYASGISPDDIDLVIVKTLTPDRMGAPNAPLVQHKLKLNHAGAYDMNSCCSSLPILIDMAAALVSSGRKKNILIVDSSLTASYLNDKSKPQSVLYGDAVVAGIVSSVDQGDGCIVSETTSHGAMPDALVFDHAPPRMHHQHWMLSEEKQWVFTHRDMQQCEAMMAYDEIAIPKVSESVLAKAGMKLTELDLFLTIQPFMGKMLKWQQSMQLTDKQFFHTFYQNGHCLGSAPGINLVEAISETRIKAGDHVLITTPGAGITIASLLYRVNAQLINNVNKLFN